LRTALIAICGRDTASVDTNNGLNECKSKPVPARCASFDSALEEVTNNLRIETGAVVFHGKRRQMIVCAKRDADQA
jgi:hypothetical protein